MSDLVEREAAMRLIENKPYDWSNLTERHNMLMEIRKLPSVTQKSETVTEFADRCRECGARYGELLKQKSGKWLYKEITGDYRVTGQCSECKKRRIIDNYCPNCGARMVEPQESETWNGYHGQVTAPKGTFKKIWEEAESEE